MAGKSRQAKKQPPDKIGTQRAEELLRESEERFRTVFEEAHLGIVIVSPSFVFEEANPAFCRMMGYSADELRSMTFADITHPDHLSQDMENVKKVERGEIPFYQTEKRYIRKDGAVIWGNLVVSSIRDEHGRLRYYLSMVNDITEHKQAEEALRESEAKYRSIVETTTEWIWEIDLEGRHTYSNLGVTAILGYRPEEFVGQAAASLLHEDDQAEVEARLPQLIAEKRGWREWILRWRHKDGSYRFLESNAEPILDSAGHVQGYRGTDRDITERKRSEEALKERAVQLALLNRIGEQVAGVLDLDNLLDRAVTLIQESFGYQHVGLFILEREQGALLMKARAGSYASSFPADHRLKVGQGMVGWVAEHSERLLANNVSAEPRFYNPLPDHIIQAELAVPIEVGMEVVGVLDIQSQQANAFDEDDILVLETLADQIAVAIHNARLYEGIRQRAAELEALRQVALGITGQLDLDTLLEQLVRSALQLLGVQSGGIYLYRPELNALEWAFRIGADTAPLGANLRRGEGLAGKVWQTGKPLLVDDYSTWAGRATVYAGYEFGAVLAAPIQWGGNLLGVVTATTGKDRPRRFTERDAHLLSLFADQAAIAIQNVRLYGELENYNTILQQAVQEATTELRRSKDHVAAILDSVGEGLAVTSAEGRIHQVNPAFIQQTGYTLEEVELKDIRDLLGIESLSPESVEKAFAVLPPGQIWRGEVAIRRKDGSRFDAAMTISSMHDQEGKVARLVVSIRDISPLKEVERMKDAFVSNVSHELRTPITSLKLNQDLMKRNPQKLEVYLMRMERETTRLNMLIENLLRLSRLDQGRVELNFAPLDLNALAAKYVEDRGLLAESKQLHLTLETSPDLPPVQADEGLLGQALSVLLTNALNYTPAGGKVVVRTHVSQFDERQWAGFSVSDDGPGIAPHEQPNLFQRFFRGTVGRASGVPGTGLGLAIAREIVERHGGRIEVSSKGAPGEGTTFAAWLPVVEKGDGKPVSPNAKQQ